MSLLAGDLAPDFSLEDQHGHRTELCALRDAGPVLVVFYPFAFTPVCTSELAELAARHAELMPASVVAISCDPVPTLRAFADQEGYGSLRLLSDFWPHGEISRAYGAFHAEQGYATRVSYLIGPDATVLWRGQSPLGQGRSFDDYVEAVAEFEVRS